MVRVETFHDTSVFVTWVLTVGRVWFCFGFEIGVCCMTMAKSLSFLWWCLSVIRLFSCYGLLSVPRRCFVL
jgi:hypothetical protein